jgi:hypothetical protein
MKHLIIFGIIIIGFLLLKLSYQINCRTENFSDVGCINPNIYIGQSEIGGKYGRGIFANRDFTIDEIFEKAPYIEDKLDKFNGISRDYVFNTKDGLVALGFGYASLYNHSDEPNATWYFEKDRIVFKTLKPIKKDTEILVSYGTDYWKTRKHIEKI